jgi:hypothetical protein
MRGQPLVGRYRRTLSRIITAEVDHGVAVRRAEPLTLPMFLVRGCAVGGYWHAPVHCSAVLHAKHTECR